MNNAEWLLSQSLPEMIDRHTREALFVLGDDVIPAEFGGTLPPGMSGERFRQLRALLSKAYAEALRQIATDSASSEFPPRVQTAR